MEEAAAAGDLQLVRDSLKSMLLVDWDGNTSALFADKLMPGAYDVVQRSIYMAALHGHTHIFSFLADQGAGLDRYVVTAIFQGSRVDLWEALLQHGWKPRADNMPIWDILANKTCLSWLLEHGWDPNGLDYSQTGDHPLAIAAGNFPLATVKVLLEHGVTSRGTLAMHKATNMSAEDPTRFEVLDLLLQYDGDVNEMELDPKGRKRQRRRASYRGTPLHLAVGTRNEKAVRYLLDRGASPLAPSWSGVNALQAAEESHQTAIVAYISDLIREDTSGLPSTTTNSAASSVLNSKRIEYAEKDRSTTWLKRYLRPQ